jgi:hypothetical protein
MKKEFMYISGIVIILSLTMSAGLFTLFTFISIVDILINGADDVTTLVMFALPMLIYFWWAFPQKWSRDQISKLLNYEEK